MLDDTLKVCTLLLGVSCLGPIGGTAEAQKGENSRALVVFRFRHTVQAATSLAARDAAIAVD